MAITIVVVIVVIRGFGGIGCGGSGASCNRSPCSLSALSRNTACSRCNLSPSATCYGRGCDEWINTAPSFCIGVVPGERIVLVMLTDRGRLVVGIKGTSR